MQDDLSPPLRRLPNAGHAFLSRLISSTRMSALCLGPLSSIHGPRLACLNAPTIPGKSLVRGGFSVNYFGAKASLPQGLLLFLGINGGNQESGNVEKCMGCDPPWVLLFLDTMLLLLWSSPSFVLFPQAQGNRIAMGLIFFFHSFK